MTRRKPTELLLDYSLHIALILLAVCCAILRPQFLAIAPLDIIKRTAAYLIMALAMGCVLRIGEIDLAQGRTMGLAAVIGAHFLINRAAASFSSSMINPYLLIALVTLGAIILGAVIGFANGWITAKLRVPSWLTTLAVQLILYGIMLIFLVSTQKGGSISNLMPEYADLVTHRVTIGGWAIPNYVWFAIGMTVIVGLLWYFTGLGLNMKAVGENRAAAKTAGINIDWTIILTFVVAGALCGICGIIEAARVGGPGVSAGSNAEFESLIACLIGGFSLRGGRGNIFGVVVGMLFLQLLNVCLQWLNVPANLVYIIMGVLLIIAAALSINRDLRKARKPEVISAAQEGDEVHDTQETA